jgi:hypothetical protein
MRTPFFGEGNAPPTHKSGDRWPRSRSEIRSSYLYISLSRPGQEVHIHRFNGGGRGCLSSGQAASSPHHVSHRRPPHRHTHTSVSGVTAHAAPGLVHKSALRPAPALRRRLPGPRARLAESMQFNACGIIDTVHHVSVAFARHTSTGLSCGGGGLGLGYI